MKSILWPVIVERALELVPEYVVNVKNRSRTTESIKAIAWRQCAHEHEQSNLAYKYRRQSFENGFKAKTLKALEQRFPPENRTVGIPYLRKQDLLVIADIAAGTHDHLLHFKNSMLSNKFFLDPVCLFRSCALYYENKPNRAQC